MSYAGRRLTDQQLRDLAECERMMGDGRMPFVILHGERVSVSKEAMAEFGLRQGQTINVTISIAILEFSLAYVETIIALDKAKAAASTKS